MSQPPALERISAFSFLMGLYAENHERMLRLAGKLGRLSGVWLSAPSGAEPLWLEVIDQLPYTTILRLTHRFDVDGLEQRDPCAYVRVYHDARMAEVTHCHASAALRELFSMRTPTALVRGHRERMNGFFNKWLEFLLEAGHHPGSFKRTRLAKLPPLETGDLAAAVNA